MVSIDHLSSSKSPKKMSPKWARKCERYCCIGVTYFPLFFVYSITTWALWVETTIGFLSAKTSWIGSGISSLGIVLYILLNWSYTTAVFTNPGTTIDNKGYSSLPTHASTIGKNFTVKANGELRYCKKCQAHKPDRAHHCSTCRVCVLKMDHHCPWLATCVGLRNYKAFLLFLGYTTLFCFVCFGVSGFWVWREIVHKGEYTESLMPINFVILAVISGIIGLLLAGFTGWHILLASRGQTTIECLEKTRYLPTAHNSMFNKPGPTVPLVKDTVETYDEATENSRSMHDLDSPTIHLGERVNYNDYERARSRIQYEKYLDEQDSAKLPSAFDLGWRINLLHLFGPNKLLWFFPVVTTIGDGWNWDPNPDWVIARERILLEREQQRQRENFAGWGSGNFSSSSISLQEAMCYDSGSLKSSPHTETIDLSSRQKSKADRILGRTNEYSDGVLLDNLRPTSSSDRYQVDRKADLGWPQKNCLATNTLSSQKILRINDHRVWDRQDQGND
ncbi:Palmitoyltransferase pfa3 [Golovinomyces cichoracearum]|uniref:Palmitoyltransferase n=1 Tax=Golovinomyces cichoracearum TaxID=62708 RepID=A0A420H7B0_9PEZI|nr:Palmitoyltransferase pfa3 [Golovinomyces cichoracearum]